MRTYVYQLRRLLVAEGLDSKQLSGRHSGYVLQISPEDLDLTPVKQLAKKGRSELSAGRAQVAARILREVLTQWSGPALADVPHGRFLRAMAAELNELRRHILESSIRADLMLGRHREVIGELHRLVATDPLNEDANGLRTSYVDADNRGGGRRATDYLIRQGRRHVATIAGSPQSRVGSDHLTGYRRALDGRPKLVSFGGFSESSGVLAMRRLLGEQANIDAVFAASDNMAIGALRELERQGRRVPDDVAVIGFEDTGLLFGKLALTTVHQPTRTMDQRMLETLVSQIKNVDRGPSEMILDTRVAVRETA